MAFSGLAIKAAMEFESSFAGVRKTVNATEPQFAALAQGFRNMAKEIPVGVNDLNKIGELGGQLGIPQENLLDFTRVIAELGVTTNLSIEEAASSFARFANITNMPLTELRALGDVVVNLGNNLATTEAEIVEFGLRIAATGELAGMSEGRIMAIGAAFSSVGIQAEAGGTAVNKTIQKMMEAVVTGGKSLAQFGAVSGLGSGGFAELFDQNSSDAFLKFIEGLGAQGREAIPLLKSMGLSDIRQMRALLSLSVAQSKQGGSSLLADAFGFADNSKDALGNEAAQRFKTFESQMKLFTNAVYDARIELGNQMIPAILRMQPAVMSVLNGVTGLVGWFSRLPQGIQTSVFAFGGLLAALGPIAWAFGSVLQAGGSLLGLFRMLGGSTIGGVLVTAFSSARIAVVSFSAAALAIPGVQIAAAIGLIASAFAMMGPKVREAEKEFGSFQAWIRTTATMLQWIPGFGPRIAHEFGLDQAKTPDRLLFTSGTVGADVELADNPIARMAEGIREQQRIDTELRKRYPELFPSGGGGEKKSEAQKAAEAYKKATDDLFGNLSGADALKTSKMWTDQVQKLGGVTKLTAEHQETFAKHLQATLDHMVAMGQQMPLDQLQAWAGLQKASTVPVFASEMGSAALDDARVRAEMKALSELTIGWMGYAQAVGIAPQLIEPDGAGGYRYIGEGQPAFYTGINPTAEDITNPKHIPGFFESAFGTSKDFGANLSDVMMRALTGGGDLGKSIGGFFGGSLFGEKGLGGMLGGMFGEKGISGLLGGALGSFLPGIGTMLGTLIGPLIGKLTGKLGEMFGIGNAGRDLVKDFAGDHGGFDSLHDKLLEMGGAGEELWKKLTQGVGRNNPEEAKKVIDEVGAALDAWPEKKAEAIATFTEGAATRIKAFTDVFAKDETLKLGGLDGVAAKMREIDVLRSKLMGRSLSESETAEADKLDTQWDELRRIRGTSYLNALGGDPETVQQEFALMGLYAGTAFSTTLREYGIQKAITEAGPLFDQLIGIGQQFGFELQGSAAQFASFYHTAQQNEGVLAALDGITQMIRGSGDALFLNQELFSAFGTDAATQFNILSERGVEANQALAFMQPTLQALWEAQNKFGFATDASTQALIDQGIQQGIVGDHMKSVNEQILAVLIGIADVFGAKIPDAMRGLPAVAEGAAAGMNDAFSKVKGPTFGMNIPPGVEHIDPNGGVVSAQPGDPSYDKYMGDGGTSTTIIELNGQTIAEGVVPYIPGEVQRLGAS